MSVVVAVVLAGCFPSSSHETKNTPTPDTKAPVTQHDGSAPPPKADGSTTEPTDPVECAADAKDAIQYLDIANHPGCTVADSVDTTGKLVRKLEYTPASIPGFKCAAKEYLPASEDTSKPIFLLVHGNSDRPVSWEKCTDATNGGACLSTGDRLAEQLTAKGYRVLAVDMRYERGCNSVQGGYTEDCATKNPGKNMSHRWTVPITQHFIRSVLEAYKGRRISLAGHSMGVTTIRDALRRLQCVEKYNPWPRIQELVFAAGGNHGVSTFDSQYCTKYADSMRGQVTCEMGSRQSYTPTAFSGALNGPSGAYETPCSASNRSAYGWAKACGSNTARYLTVVMQDKSDGTFKDEFVSEASAALKGADNQTLLLTDVDTTGYFFPQKDFNGLGLFNNHFGAHRSDAAISKMIAGLK